MGCRKIKRSGFRDDGASVMALATTMLIVVCALALMPIGLVRTVVGATWPMIGRAYLVWIALLLLMFQPRWATSDPNLGWAFIFAVFLTVPAIFFLAAVQKVIVWISGASARWNQFPAQHQRLGDQIASGHQHAEPTTARRLLYTFFGQYWAATLGVFAVIVASVVFAYFHHRAVLLSTAQDLFALPPTVRFSDVRVVGKSSTQRPQFEAIIQLTSQEYADYVAKLENSVAWQNGDLFFDGKPVEPSSDSTLRWEAWPMQVRAHNRHMNFGRLSRDALTQLRSGWALCYAIVRNKPPMHDLERRRTVPTLSAKPCADLDRQDRRVAWRLAVLDPATRTLHVIVM